MSWIRLTFAERMSDLSVTLCPLPGPPGALKANAPLLRALRSWVGTGHPHGLAAPPARCFLSQEAEPNLKKPFLHTQGHFYSWPTNSSCFREYCFPDLNQNFFICVKCIGFHFYIHLTSLLSYLRMCLALIMILKFCTLIILQLRFKTTPEFKRSEFSCSFTELSLIWELGHGTVGKKFYF